VNLRPSSATAAESGVTEAGDVMLSVIVIANAPAAPGSGVWFGDFMFLNFERTITADHTDDTDKTATETAHLR